MAEQSPTGWRALLANRALRWSLQGLVSLLVLAGIANHLLGLDATWRFKPEDWNRKVREQAYDVTIRRDKWGIPHILGARDRDVSFGVAWAHAEDALEDTETLIRTVKGMAAAQGAEGAPSDWLLAAMESHTLAKQAWAESEQLSPQVRAYLEGYADGLNYFAAQNPELVDKTLYPVTPQELVAGMHFQVPQFYGLGSTIGEMVTGAEGSNAIAVSPQRGWGQTHLVINPHQPMDGPFSWYEMHLHSEEGVQVMGGGFPGTPFVYVGFNEHLGWGGTVNDPPGLISRYRLQLDPEDPRRYKLDGVWREMRVVKVPIRVGLFANFAWTVEEEIEFTDHGLVIRDDEGAVALAWAGMRDTAQAEQWYRMNRAKSLQDWLAALRLRHLPSLNLTYADREGNIHFLYNAKLRLRAPGYDWSEPVDGSDGSLIAMPLVPFDRLPQVLNPDSGYLLSANQHPFAITTGRDSPRRRDFPEAWGIETRVTNRGVRGLELLNQPGNITSERLQQIKMDHSYSERWEGAVQMRRILGLDLPRDADLREGQRILGEWNLAADLENRGAALGTCTLWRIRKALRAGQLAASPLEADAEAEDQRLIEILDECVEVTDDLHGELEPAWKDINLLRRGEGSWPLEGGPDTLRAVYSGERDGEYRATAGDGLTYFVRWDREGKMHSQGIHQYGASRVPRDPHYADQAPLFARGELRETSYHPEELKANTFKTTRLPLR